jgi:hypothetical protein
MIKDIDKLKIPEGISVPYFGKHWNSLINVVENQYIKSKVIEDFALNTEKRKEYIVVSLTSFPARIQYVHYTIRSLMRQTVKPDRIVIYLAREQFKYNKLPSNLSQLQEYGLEIRFCEDLKSHKKYYHSMKEQGNNLLVTYDDDIIYPEDSIERLYLTYLKYPNCIICNRGLEITYEGKIINPYSKWKVYSPEGVYKPSTKIMPSTGGGTLYPPNSVNERVFDINAIKKYALTADDLWMKTMSLLNKTFVVKTRKYHKPFTVVNGTQSFHLAQENCLGGKNDMCMHVLMNKYPSAMYNLINEGQEG